MVSRTLCPVDAVHRKNITEQQTVYLDVSTMEKNNVAFSLEATSLSSFQLRCVLYERLTGNDRP